MGQAPAGDSYNIEGQGFPLIAGAGDFGPNYPSVKKFTSAPTKLCAAGDIVLGIRATIGVKVWADADYCLGRGVAGLRPRDSKVLDSRYLWHWLSHSRNDLQAKGKGATFLQVNRLDISEMQIPLPPLSEQRRIAGILDAADGLRAKRQETIALLDTLTQSIFLDMFGDADPGWVRCVVLDAAADDKGSIRTGPFGSQLLHSEFVDAGVAVLGIDNAVNNRFRWGERRFITESKYQELSRYRVYPGDVLITIMGTTGRCAVVPDDIPVAINTKHLCCISLNRQKCLPEYLHAYFLHHPDARDYLGRQGKGAIMVGLNMGLIKAMPLILPPIDLQAQFAARLNAVGQVLDATVRASAEVDSLFATLQARMFRGEL